MIISFRHNFIYWRPQKVGGSAVLQGLGEYCGGADIVNYPNEVYIEDTHFNTMHIHRSVSTGPNSRNFTKYTRHMLPDAIRETSKVNWDSFFKFTIVRNPWDMTVSMYWWDKRPGDTFSEWLAKGVKHDFNSPPIFFHEDYYFKDGKKYGVKISFLEFMKFGAIISLISLVIASFYLMLYIKIII